MATIKFYTRTNEKEILTSIYLKFTHGRDIDLRMRTGYRVPINQWDNKKGAVKGGAIYTEEFTENQFENLRDNLNKLKDAILKQMINQADTPTKQWLKDQVDRFINKDKKTGKSVDPETFVQYFERFMKEAEAGERLNSKNMKYRHSTLKTYKSTLKLFTEFQGRKRFKFDAINMDNYTKIVEHFTRLNCSQNYIGKHIKIIKLVMRSAREEGLHNNQEIERKAFKVMREPVQNIYLTEDELRRLAAVDLTDDKPRDLARDVFLIGCYTAQRYSDYSRINPDMIRTLSNGVKVLELIQQKTGEKVLIPINPECDQLLMKYEYRLPHTWQQKVNDYIKDVGALAKITDPVQVEKSKGGLIEKTTVNKNKLIMTHTARRTGCTNMYLADIPTLDIMHISGHKTENEFLKYIKVSKEETATKMSRHPYFNKPVMKIAR